MNKYVVAMLLMLSLFFHGDIFGAVNKYDSRIIDKNYKVDLSKYQDYQGGVTVSDELLNGNIIKTHQALISGFDSLNSLKYSLEPMIKEEMESIGIHYRWFNFNVTGPIEVKLSGTSNGTIKAEISKFSLYGKAKGEKSWYLNVYATLSMNNAYASGEFDLSTGKIINLRLKNDFEFDVDSTLNYIIPGIDDLATIWLKGVIINNLASSISEYEGYKTIYGLNNVVPANKYVFNGVDFGWELDQLLTGMIDGEFIKITMNNVVLLPSTRPICYEPGSASWSNDIAEINLSNKAFMKISREVTQSCVWNGSGGETDY